MMALELYMVGLVAQDLDASLEFYRRLGVAIPEDSEGQQHVEVKMGGGLTFFLDAPRKERASNSPRVILEFYLPSRDAVDAKYAAMAEFGYQTYRAPYFNTQFAMYFAMINDPDGNTVLLSAS
jgi:predicted lactoylglutathione lyase